MAHWSTAVSARPFTGQPTRCVGSAWWHRFATWLGLFSVLLGACEPSEPPEPRVITARNSPELPRTVAPPPRIPFSGPQVYDALCYIDVDAGELLDAAPLLIPVTLRTPGEPALGCHPPGVPITQARLNFRVPSPGVVQLTRLATPSAQNHAGTTVAMNLQDGPCPPAPPPSALATIADSLPSARPATATLAREECHVGERHIIVSVEPGITYTVQIEAWSSETLAAPASGELYLELLYRERSCEPGAEHCAGGAIVYCAQGLDSEAWSCLGDCLDAGRCRGETCEEALSIALEPLQPRVLTAHRHAYASNWQVDQLATCSPWAEETLAEDPAMPGEGSDAFLRLPGLKTGQILRASTDTPAGEDLFVLTHCQSSQCLTASPMSEDLALGEPLAIPGIPQSYARLRWSVPHDGDFVLAIKSRGLTARQWHLALVVEPSPVARSP